MSIICENTDILKIKSKQAWLYYRSNEDSNLKHEIISSQAQNQVPADRKFAFSTHLQLNNPLSTNLEQMFIS